MNLRYIRTINNGIDGRKDPSDRYKYQYSALKIQQSINQSTSELSYFYLHVIPLLDIQKHTVHFVSQKIDDVKFSKSKKLINSPILNKLRTNLKD